MPWRWRLNPPPWRPLLRFDLRILLKSFYFLALALLATAWGCLGDPDALKEGIETAYDRCDPVLQARLVEKAGLKPLFSPCTTTSFLHHRWSPQGKRLYYQTPGGAYLLDADAHTTRSLPIGFPAGAPVWLDEDRLAFPQRSRTGEGIGVYDVARNTVEQTPLPLVDLGSLERGKGPDEVFLLASHSARGARRIFRVRSSSGQWQEVLPQIMDSIEEFSYRASQDLLACRSRDGEDVVAFDASSGEVRARFPGARRASLSADGRFWVVEGDGAPVDTLPNPPRGVSLPRWLPRKLVPRVMWLQDARSHRRTPLSGIFGHRFEWYDAKDYFGSFVLLGLSGQEVPLELVLIDLQGNPGLGASSPPGPGAGH